MTLAQTESRSGASSPASKKNKRSGGSSHPLCGANMGTLLSVLDGAGGVPLKHWPQMAMIFGSILGRLPFSAAEKVYANAKLKSAEVKTPIFILGHWRSGTTHLYNVMSQDNFGYVPPLAAGMPWDVFGLMRMFRPLLERALPEHRFIDSIPVTPKSPQEDEVPVANMVPVSFYHGLYFPEHFDRHFDGGIFLDGLTEKQIAAWERAFLHFLGKLSVLQDGRRMLIKNPVYTARVAHIRKLFPDARFIHIHRNPHEVFRSMQNFYDKLFAQFALQPYDHVDVDEVILRTYPRMMDRLVEDTKDLPAEKFVELRYDELDADAMGALETIYGQLQIPGFDAAKPRFEAYLGTVKSYRKNAYVYPTESAELVENRWGAFLDRWEYGRPGDARPADIPAGEQEDKKEVKQGQAS